MASVLTIPPVKHMKESGTTANHMVKVLKLGSMAAATRASFSRASQSDSVPSSMHRKMKSRVSGSVVSSSPASPQRATLKSSTKISSKPKKYTNLRKSHSSPVSMTRRRRPFSLTKVRKLNRRKLPWRRAHRVWMYRKTNLRTSRTFVKPKL